MKNIFEKNIKINDINVKYAKGKSERQGIEIHPFHEIIYFLSGDVTLFAENQKLKIKNNSLIVIPKNTYHSFEFLNEEEYHRLVFHFYDIKEFTKQLDKLISNNMLLADNLKDDIINLFDRIIVYFSDDYDNNDFELLLKSSFIEMIVKLGYIEKNEITSSRNADTTLAKMLEFIDNNFCKGINSEIIAKEFFLSKSTVEHLFKKEMNIPIHRYITEKRLNYAYSLLLDSTPATQVATLCGYNEYSVFYRAFKKMFSVSPKKIT